MPYKRSSNPAGYTKNMLPLFGRTKRAVVNILSEAVDDEWCVPSDQELYGSQGKQGKVRDDHAGVLSDTDNIATANITAATSDTVNITIDNLDITADNLSDNLNIAAIVDDATFQSMNNESDCTFSNDNDDTFSIMNNETTIISCPVVNTSADISFPTSDAFKTVLERLVDLERKYEELNMKVTNMEQDSQKGNSKQSIFGNDFIEFMQEVMKSGLDYQQRFLGKFIDELDGMFDIDFTNFDPFKE